MSLPPEAAPRTPPPITSSRVGVLDRSVAILSAVEGGARTFTQITRATGLTRPTAHRLLKALESHGLVASTSGGYRLGPRLLSLSASAVRDLPLRDVAHPVLERLARETGESVQLYVREADKRICVDAVQSDSELRTIVEIGAALPLVAGSAGKVFLAHLSGPFRSELVSHATKLTDKTPQGRELFKQLDDIKEAGFATSSGERQPGVGSVSAPVFGTAGDVLAVVSVSGPESRLGRSGARRYAGSVLAAAREIEAGLGVSPPQIAG